MATRQRGLRLFLNGNLRRLSSFSIINRHLIRGLRRRGYRVDAFAADDPATMPGANPAPPDVYIFHGHPWDDRSAPGRLNIFTLNYEYLEPDRTLRALVARLNAAFDLVVIPSAFAKSVLTSAGLRIPVEIVPWGFDPAQFHPGTRPVRRAQPQSFAFVYAGAVNERKGVDRLLAAYLAEFTADDDVVLVIKESQRHPTWREWVEDTQRRHLGGDRATAAHRRPVQWVHADSAGLAGYFTAADVGVFPHRGEGFGLPILECIASGRPVIVTTGTGPAAYCTAQNSHLIRTRRVRHHGRVQLEPDVRHLRSLLRAAFERGATTARQAAAISRTVRQWTWQRSVAALDAAIQRHFPRTVRASGGPPGAARRPAAARRPPAVAYAFYTRGATSWKKICTETDRALRARFAAYRGLTHRDPIGDGDVDIVVGQSEHCLELLLRVRRRNPGAIAVVHQECTVLGDRLAIVNRERRRCGLAPIAMPPIDFWRNRRENQLANCFIVPSTVARRCFLANGFAAERVHVIPLGMRRGAFHFRGHATTTRFLFVGTDPFRKGVRILLAAWDRAALRHAELICCTDLEVLQSKLLLRYLVRNPNVIIRPLSSYRDFTRQYAEVDCQVLPSLEDTFSMAIGDGMGVGKPAIVSTATGIQDFIRHGVNGHVVRAGDVDQLADSLRAFAADRRRLRAMGEAAYETARRATWARYRRGVGDLVASLAAAR